MRPITLAFVLTACSTDGNVHIRRPHEGALCDTATPTVPDPTEPTDTTTPTELPTYVGMLMDDVLMIFKLDPDGNRWAFPERSWYYTWEDSVDQVVILNHDDMAALPLMGSMTPRPTSVMVKVTSDTTVWWIEENPNDAFDPVLRPIADEATATALVGVNWNDYVLDIPDVFFPDFNTAGEMITQQNVGNVATDVGAMKLPDDLHE